MDLFKSTQSVVPGSDGVRQFSALAENANLIGSALTFPVRDMVYRLNETYLYKPRSASQAVPGSAVLVPS